MQSDQEALRARVFISCGQSRDSEEITTATAIRNKLEELGFSPYVAVNEQSLRGLKENIFEQLRSSEYFIFVDFKRERLGCGDPVVYRGSLFSHQELALASYLDIPVLALQESGVKQDDGIIRFLQTNATPFTDRHLLPDVIAERIRARGWNPSSRNELVLVREPGQFSVANRVGPGGQPLPPGQEIAKFFHIGVYNRHSDLTARNCFVYLEKASRLDPLLAPIPMNAVEFKWAGYRLPNANIPAKTERRFDALFLLIGHPEAPQFNTFADSTEFIPQFAGAARYELTYLVVSDNFPPARGSFILNLTQSLDGTSLIART